MADSSSPQLSLAQKIDKFCDRFEADWSGGKKPRIESYLDKAPEAVRPQLLRSLLRVELELRRQAGEEPSRKELLGRFPQHSAIVETVLNETTPPQTSADVPGEPGATAAFVPGSSNGPTPAASGAPAPAPRKFGRFVIVGVLGQGGFGTVYRARDPQLDREVALKVPKPGVLASDDDRERFLREGKAAATLSHPSICPVFEAGVHEGRHYIVMALVEGKSLAQVIRQNAPLDPRSAATMVRKAALALHEAHQKGIIHRDLKPGNIMIDHRGQPIIMDFGLSRRCGPEEAPLTQTGAIMGTPDYMAPEQASARHDQIGPATDVYALGVILHEMLTGRRPYSGDVQHVLRQVIQGEPPPPSSHRHGLDPRLDEICRRALSKDVADRFQTMRELAEGLNEYLKATEPATAAQQQAAEATREVAALVTGLHSELSGIKQAQRVSWWKWSVAAAALAVLVAGVVFLVVREPTHEVRLKFIEPFLADASLSYFLDDRPVSADVLTQPIPLPAGDHLLEIKRRAFVIRQFKFHVNPGEPIVAQADEVYPPLTANTVDANYALDFSNRDLYAVLPQWKYDGTHPLTLEAWIAQNQEIPAGDGGRIILGHSEDGALGLRLGPGGLSWSIRGGDGLHELATERPPGLGAPVHVAAVIDGRELRLYVDGSLAEKTEWNGEYVNSSAPFVLGAHAQGDGVDRFFPGLIDEVRVSRIARYAEDFQPTLEFAADADTLLLYHCDEGVGEMLQDSSGREQHGKIVAATWVPSFIGNGRRTTAGDIPPPILGLASLRDGRVVVAVQHVKWVSECVPTTKQYTVMRNEPQPDGTTRQVPETMEKTVVHTVFKSVAYVKELTGELGKDLRLARVDGRRLDQAELEQALTKPALALVSPNPDRLDRQDARVYQPDVLVAYFSKWGADDYHHFFFGGPLFDGDLSPPSQPAVAAPMPVGAAPVPAAAPAPVVAAPLPRAVAPAAQGAASASIPCTRHPRIAEAQLVDGRLVLLERDWQAVLEELRSPTPILPAPPSPPVAAPMPVAPDEGPVMVSSAPVPNFLPHFRAKPVRTELALDQVKLVDRAGNTRDAGDLAEQLATPTVVLLFEDGCGLTPGKSEVDTTVLELFRPTILALRVPTVDHERIVRRPTEPALPEPRLARIDADLLYLADLQPAEQTMTYTVKHYVEEKVLKKVAKTVNGETMYEDVEVTIKKPVYETKTRSAMIDRPQNRLFLLKDVAFLDATGRPLPAEIAARRLLFETPVLVSTADNPPTPAALRLLQPEAVVVLLRKGTPLSLPTYGAPPMGNEAPPAMPVAPGTAPVTPRPPSVPPPTSTTRTGGFPCFMAPRRLSALSETRYFVNTCVTSTISFPSPS